jgi:hypothetical protein
MTTYTVHIYREMRVVFGGIEAETPEAAATIARDMPTGDADDIDDCEGESFSALVDVQGDEEYEHSRFIDFEVESQRKLLPELLEALRRAEFLMHRVHQGDHRALEKLHSAANQARRVLRKAKAAKYAIDKVQDHAPLIVVTLEGGLIGEMEATIPTHVIVEDHDVPDEHTGKRPSSSVWRLPGGLAAKKAAKFRRLIAND